MFCTGGSAPYSARIETKENLSGGFVNTNFVYFVNTNPPEERVQVLHSEKELSQLPGNSPNISKKSNIDCFRKRPSATFCNGKYSILHDFCYAEFLAYYTLENKSSKTGEYQPDELDDNLIENNHEECS